MFTKLKNNPYLLLVPLFLVFAYLNSRFFLWGDEVWSFNYASKGVLDFLHEYFFVYADNHPPLYYFFLNIVNKLFRVTASTDWIYKVFSLLFHFGAVTFIYFKYLEDKKERLVFLILAAFSSFFFLYSRMLRYYSLAAFLLVVAFYNLQAWQLKANRRYRNFFFLFLILIMWTDYPSFVYFAVISLGELFFKKRYKELFFICSIVFIAALPLVWINFKDVVIHTKIASPSGLLGSIAKFGLGIGFPFYHFLIGDFFKTSSFLFLVPFVLGGGLVVLVSKERTLKNYLLLFVLINSFLLTFFIKRYPVFSYARFILFAGYLYFIIMAKFLAQQNKKMPLTVLCFFALNILVIGSNSLKLNFINPIYFIPQETITTKVDKYLLEYPNSKIFYDSINSTPYYLAHKYFDSAKSNQIEQGNTYILFRPMRLYETELDILTFKNKFQEEHGVLFINQIGFDNMGESSKKLLQKYGLMKIPFKYYLFVFRG